MPTPQSGVLQCTASPPVSGGERVEFIQAGEQRLDPHLPTLIGNHFGGAETEILGGVPDHDPPHPEAIDACTALIARIEQP